MDLAAHQRKLLGLIKSTYQGADDDDPYIRAVADSEHLRLVREIADWWRIFNLEQYCVLTSRLLKRKGLFEETVHAFSGKSGLSPYIERLGAGFLEEMSRHHDSLVASVARFELALIRIKRGDVGRYVVNWRHAPHIILDSLIRGSPYSEKEAEGLYQTVVSIDLPGLFQIVEIGESDEAATE